MSSPTTSAPTFYRNCGQLEFHQPDLFLVVGGGCRLAVSFLTSFLLRHSVLPHQPTSIPRPRLGVHLKPRLHVHISGGSLALMQDYIVCALRRSGSRLPWPIIRSQWKLEGVDANGHCYHCPSLCPCKARVALTHHTL